jgi:phospholipase C
MTRRRIGAGTVAIVALTAAGITAAHASGPVVTPVVPPGGQASLTPALSDVLNYVPSPEFVASTLLNGSWVAKMPGYTGLPQTPIRHVVILQKENRSFDEYFGRYPGADGATQGTEHDGTVVQLGQTPDPLPNDINHAVASFNLAYDNGKMDGFDLEKGAFSSTGQNLAYSQMRESQIPGYWAYARRYGLGDRMFASWKGSSFANNLFTVAAQSGQYDDSNGDRFAIEHPLNPKHPSGVPTWGCDDAPGTTVLMQAPDGTRSRQFPCFNYPGLPNVLDQYGVSWRYYEPPNGPLSHPKHNALHALSPVYNNPRLWSNVVPYQQFDTDALAGNLPAVSWLLGVQDEHPPRTSCNGENQTIDFINSVMHGPDWASTVFIITWDEWGGFYDHVPPPQVDAVSYGFRVPLLVISPFVKQGGGSDGGYVSHVFYSHESPLKLIETNWNLPSLTPKDAAANDMMDFFSFNTAAPAKQPLFPTPRTCPTLTPAQRTAIARSGDDY